MTDEIPDFGNPEEVKKWIEEESVLHEFRVYGLEIIERTATPVSSKSKTNRVYVPGDWVRVAVVKLE